MCVVGLFDSPEARENLREWLAQHPDVCETLSQDTRRCVVPSASEPSEDAPVHV